MAGTSPGIFNLGRGITYGGGGSALPGSKHTFPHFLLWCPGRGHAAEFHSKNSRALYLAPSNSRASRQAGITWSQRGVHKTSRVPNHTSFCSSFWKLPLLSFPRPGFSPAAINREGRGRAGGGQRLVFPLLSIRLIAGQAGLTRALPARRKHFHSFDIFCKWELGVRSSIPY